MTWKQRIEPFLDLLDARYLPLIAVVGPQAWTVYAWLLADGSPPWISIIGGLGYELVYVGAVAWNMRGAGWKAARQPAITALLFSVAVAVAYYAPRVGVLAFLHAGFPLVAYAYTRMMHSHVMPSSEPSIPSSPLVTINNNVQTAIDATSTQVDSPQRRVKALVDGGATITQAASMVGVSRQTASKYVKEVS